MYICVTSFLDSIYGHIGSSATHPCVLCEAPKSAFKGVSISAKQMDAHISQMLKRQCCIDNRCPLQSTHWSRFQLRMSFRLRCTSYKDCVKTVSVLRNRPGTNRFTGNHCRKLLAGDGPKRIADVIAGNSKHSAVEKLLTVSGTTVRADKAFFQCLRTEFPDVSVTSKAHLLCSHVVGFVRCHGFWGLISEQSVESLHRKRNDVLLQLKMTDFDETYKETIKRIQSQKGVDGVLIMDQLGRVIQSTMDNETTIKHATSIKQLFEASRSVIKQTDATDDLTFLRLRTAKKNEIMISTDKRYLLAVIYNHS
uniref:Roadblock/LAMTOR2 domain-containing protein n=1 Tax=Ditylenchus dipsaci TaxID=166011 RepID=A0A915DCT3_9BILA